MKYCPNCSQSIAKDEALCSNCGFNIEDATLAVETQAEEPPREEEITPPKRPLYKKPAFWATLTALILILLAAGGAAGYYYYNNVKSTTDYESGVKEIWIEIVAKSNSLDNTLQSVTSDADLPMLANELSEMEDTLAQKQSSAYNIDPPAKYNNKYQDFLKALDDLSNYVIKAKIMANKQPTSLGETNIKDLKNAAETAKLSADNFVSENGFINKPLASGIFKMDSCFKPIITEAKARYERKKARQTKARAETHKKQAQQTVISFMQARIHKDAADMRRYLTEAAAKAFDPDVEFEGDFDPIDFKILKTESSSKGFDILGQETDRSWEGASFNTKWQFQVIEENGSWLIDHRKVLP